MPQIIRKYRVFVASPSDVKEEREAIDEVISELNRTYGNRADLVIELLKWETHAAPAVSQTQSQDIIDSDIGNDFDLFIGILWKKFGTPTIEYNSGTEQEFQNAYNRFEQNPSTLQILFYFKTSLPASLLDIDPTQLEKVNSFRNILGDKGVLYWEYNTIEDLQKFLRIHIPKRIDDLNNLQNKVQQINLIKQPTIIQEVQTEELGIIDYQEIYIESFADCTEAVLRMSEATSWIGGEINKKTAELNDMKSQKTEIGKKVARDFFNRTAEIYNIYASRLEPEIPVYINSFERGAYAFSSMIALYRSDINEPSEEEILEHRNSIFSLLKNTNDGINGLGTFREAISSIPRMSKELNKAKNNVENKLTDLLKKLEVSKSVAIEMLKSLS